jgi:hypothetical protein
MNAPDILKYGHGWFLKQLDDFPEARWEISGATGIWSAKDVLSHIASYEVALPIILEEFISTGKSEKSPMGSDHQKFNDDETSKRKGKSKSAILEEYNNAYEQVSKLITQISPEKCREVGTIPWYGEEYSLDDYLVYNYYGHKREHGSQIAEFKNKSL